MSVWIRDEQHQLVRITPQQSLRNSIVRRLFHLPSTPLMENTENQQIPFNRNEQGLPFNPQRSFDPPRQGDGVVPPTTPTVGRENVNPQHNHYRAPHAPMSNVGRTLREILRPQRTTKNSCIRLPEEANYFLVKPEMIRLLPEYQGSDSENPYVTPQTFFLNYFFSCNLIFRCFKVHHEFIIIFRNFFSIKWNFRKIYPVRSNSEQLTKIEFLKLPNE